MGRISFNSLVRIILFTAFPSAPAFMTSAQDEPRRYEVGEIKVVDRKDEKFDGWKCWGENGGSWKHEFKRVEHQ